MRSDTPRTDAQLIKSPYIGRNVCADFARQLERELAALREQLAERDAEIAALKGHAEAMADELREPMALHSYRAAYQKDAG